MTRSLFLEPNRQISGWRGSQPWLVLQGVDLFRCIKPSAARRGAEKETPSFCNWKMLVQMGDLQR